MKGAIRYMAANHVAANILMLFFLVGGLIMVPSIKQEIFPEISLDIIQIQVPYPGAAPEEVEDGILLSIEDSLTDVDGIKEIRSVASEGLGRVEVTVKQGADPDRVLQDVKNAVDRIVTFPEDAEEPIISKLLNRREVISVVVYGDVDQWTLRQYAEKVRDELLQEPGITQISLGGVRNYEISIEVPEENLRKYNLTLDQIASSIRKASQDIPGGTIKTSGGHILIRSTGKRHWAREYADIIVLSQEDGTVIRLKDISRVIDTFEDTDTFALFDGKPAAMVKIYRVGDQKPLEISETVRKYVKEHSYALPSSIKLAIWNDTSRILKGRLNLLIKNAFLGLVLVIVTLGLFLEIRLAMWVMLGIPISFLGAFLFMPILNVSINMISLFAFIMALGLVVDDAIVVGESVYTHRQRGKNFLKAAYEGTIEVAKPVVFSVLTTVVAFLPLVYVTGITGKFIKVIPLVVISILLVSLFESLLILPAHLCIGSREQGTRGLLKWIEGARCWFDTRLDAFVTGPYRAVLTFCLKYRFSTISAGISLLFLTFGLVQAGIVKFRFMPAVDADDIKVSIELPVGAPIEQTDRIRRYVQEKGLEMVKEFREKYPESGQILLHMYSVSGGTIQRGGPVGIYQGNASNLAGIDMMLSPSEERSITSTELGELWRKKVGRIAGVESIVFKSNLVHMGANLDIQLAHKDMKVLREAASRLRQALAQYQGVGDIQDTYSTGKMEFKIRLRPQARMLGITEEDIGRQIRGAFYGAEALRIQRGRNEVKVMVRYPEADRKRIWDLENMRIRTPRGGEVPITQAAIIEPGRGFSTINRFDRKRVVNVTASVNAKVANADEILASLSQGILKQLKDDYPGLTYSLEGESKEESESMGSMKQGFILALFGIYSLLAISFRSYVQPIIIMFAIPFGLVGAVFGHLIMGYDLCILSMFGLVALAGVVVNDSLLLIDYVNSLRRSGKETTVAILEAGMRRFRPILLTSLTTFFGLTPLILENSVQAQFLIPMALSLGFGILFATGITLLLIPCLYLAYEDLVRLCR